MLPAGSIVFSVDVTNLYGSIPYQEAINDAKSLLEIHHQEINMYGLTIRVWNGLDQSDGLLARTSPSRTRPDWTGNLWTAVRTRFVIFRTPIRRKHAWVIFFFDDLWSQKTIINIFPKNVYFQVFEFDNEGQPMFQYHCSEDVPCLLLATGQTAYNTNVFHVTYPHKACLLIIMWHESFLSESVFY